MTSPKNAALARPDLTCGGSPSAMGEAQGSALAERIRETHRRLADLELFRLQQPWWLPYGLFLGYAHRKVRRLLEEPLRRDHPRGAERLAGIARGAGLALEPVLLLNAFESFMSAVRDRCVVPPLGACSAVALRGSRTEGGEPVITRLFDYVLMAQPFFAVRESRPEGGLRSLDFTVAPLAGAIDGINERGLAVTYNYGYTADEAKPTGPISLAISEALDRCATVEEAARWISSRPRWGGGLLMLADASGDIASLELSSTASRLRRPEAGGDALWHTNAFSTSEMKRVEVPGNAVFDHRAPKALRGRRVHESAERRASRLEKLLGGDDRLGADEIARRLGDHGADGQASDTTVCVHGSYWHTTAVLQYFPRARRMRASFTTACRTDWREFAL